MQGVENDHYSARITLSKGLVKHSLQLSEFTSLTAQYMQTLCCHRNSRQIWVFMKYLQFHHSIEGEIYRILWLTVRYTQITWQFLWTRIEKRALHETCMIKWSCMTREPGCPVCQLWGFVLTGSVGQSWEATAETASDSSQALNEISGKQITFTRLSKGGRPKRHFKGTTSFQAGNRPTPTTTVPADTNTHTYTHTHTHTQIHTHTNTHTFLKLN